MESTQHALIQVQGIKSIWPDSFGGEVRREVKEDETFWSQISIVYIVLPATRPWFTVGNNRYFTKGPAFNLHSPLPVFGHDPAYQTAFWTLSNIKKHPPAFFFSTTHFQVFLPHGKNSRCYISTTVSFDNLIYETPKELCSAQVGDDLGDYLEPQTTSLKWMFG